MTMMARNNPNFALSLSGVTLGGLLHQTGLCVPYVDEVHQSIESVK
jgi:hypothetical protein